MIYLFIALSLLCSAFFSGLEIAFISANKLHIELENKQGKYIAKILTKFTNNESKFIGTLLVGNNIALVVYAILIAQVLEPAIYNLLPIQINNEISVLIIQTILSTILILVTGEFLPKTLFRINPNLTLNFFAIPAFIAYYICYIPVLFIIGFSELLLKYVFRVNFDKGVTSFGRVDLDNYVRDFLIKGKEKEDIDHEVQIFQNALDFKGVRIKECMIPRTEIEAIEVNESIDDLHKQFIDSGYSKILIYEEKIDNIIGFCHQSAMFKKPKTIKAITIPIQYVSETMLANDLLTKFIQQRKSIAVVVDEFGGTSGIVTIEDVFEEIFGEIDDEHDNENLMDKKINETEFILSAKHKIDLLNEKYNFKIPENDDYETLAGYIVHVHQDLPKPKSIIRTQNYEITILKASKTRVDLVKLNILDS